MPRTYVAESRIIARRNDVISNLGNPSRPIPASADAPNRGVEYTIFTQENLTAVAKDVNLVDRWEGARSDIMRTKDQVSAAIFGPMSEEDKLRAVVGVLEKKIRVATNGQEIFISVEWETPQMAYEILYAVHKRFIDTRFSEEVANISDAMAVLQSTAQRENDNVVAAIEELKQIRVRMPEDDARATAPLPVSPSGRPRRTATSSQDPKDKELDRALEEKRAQIQAASREYENRLSQLRAERAELRTTYASAHPMVIAIERKIEAMSTEPPGLATLRAEERALLSQVAVREAERANEAADRESKSYSPPSTKPAEAEAQPSTPPSDDVAYRVALEKLENASHKYNQLTDRIRAAEIELETSKAAFKYKYQVAKAPELPRKPTKKIALMLIGGGLVLAVVLALFLAAAADMVSGRFIEVWQIRQHLRVPILGELAISAVEDPEPPAPDAPSVTVHSSAS